MGRGKGDSMGVRAHRLRISCMYTYHMPSSEAIARRARASGASRILGGCPQLGSSSSASFGRTDGQGCVPEECGAQLPPSDASLCDCISIYVFTFTPPSITHRMSDSERAESPITLPPEIWTVVIGHLRRPLPPPTGNNERSSIRQPDLASALRVNKVSRLAVWGLLLEKCRREWL